jgi:hypothetical protein
MVLKQEELLARYFEHRMSVDEEQNFLIQLAASDELRTAFRSHLELQKAIRDDKDDLRAVAQVRTRTLTALGLSAAAVTPFIEQELMKSGTSEPEPQAASLAPKPTFLKRLAGFAGSRSALLTSGLLIGFTVATAIFSPKSNENVMPTTTQAVEHQGLQAPAVAPSTTNNPAPVRSTVSESSPETIHSPKGLNITSHSVNSSSSRLEHSTGGVQSNAGTSVHETAASSIEHRSTPTINVTKPSSMRVKRAIISKTSDSTTTK